MSDCGTLEVCDIDLIAECFSCSYAGKKFTQRAWNFENLWKALLNLLTLSCTNRNLFNLTNWTKETRLSTCRARGTYQSWRRGPACCSPRLSELFWGDRLSLVSTFPLTRGISGPVLPHWNDDWPDSSFLLWESLKTVLMCKTQIVTHTLNHQTSLRWLI